MTKKPKPFYLEVFLYKLLRGAFRRTPMYKDAKDRAKEDYFEDSKHGKPMRRVHYKCAECGGFFKDRTGQKEIAVDHIESVIPLDRPIAGMGEYIERLFCSVDNLQVLCNYKGLRDGKKSCHATKTAGERTLAAKNRKERKK